MDNNCKDCLMVKALEERVEKIEMFGERQKLAAVALPKWED